MGSFDEETYQLLLREDFEHFQKKKKIAKNGKKGKRRYWTASFTDSLNSGFFNEDNGGIQ